MGNSSRRDMHEIVSSRKDAALASSSDLFCSSHNHFFIVSASQLWPSQCAPRRDALVVTSPGLSQRQLSNDHASCFRVPCMPAEDA